MAHAIDESTGQAAVFTGRNKPAWHKLGAVIEGLATAQEGIELAGQNWSVLQLPLQAELGHDVDFGDGFRVPGHPIPIPGMLANVRSDTGGVLGVVTDRYTPYQNASAWDFCEQVLGTNGGSVAHYDTAGCLDGGKRTWILAVRPQDLQVTKGDWCKQYLLFSNGHDGKTGLAVHCVSTRVVCANTLRLAHGEKGCEGISLCHKGDVKARLEEARKKVGLGLRRFEVFEAQAKALVEKRINREEAHTYFEQLFPTKVKPQTVAPSRGNGQGSLLDFILDDQAQQQTVVADLLEGHYATCKRQAERNKEILGDILTIMMRDGRDVPAAAGTAWAAYNGVSEWADHKMGYKGSYDDKANSRLNSVWFGRADALKQHALTAALDLCK